MSRLPRQVATSTDGDCPKVLGPDTGLAQVFAFFESAGFSDPSAAWQAFTGIWNWAAPLTTAIPGADVRDRPVVRPVAGGFMLSGPWRLPSHDGTGPWLALPMTADERQSGHATATRGGPDLFVVPSKVLPGTVRGRAGDGGGSGPVFRLEDVYVPAGFVTHMAGTPLRAGDATFFWTVVTALALGAARRMTDVLAGPAPGTASRTARGPVPHAVVAAELAAELHDERLSLAAALHGAGSARQGVPSSVEKQLAAHAGQAGNAVRHVVAVAYEHAPASGGSGGQHPLMSVIRASSPILQQTRYATELLPPDDRTSPRKAEHGDDRRISG